MYYVWDSHFDTSVNAIKHPTDIYAYRQSVFEIKWKSAHTNQLFAKSKRRSYLFQMNISLGLHKEINTSAPSNWILMRVDIIDLCECNAPSHWSNLPTIISLYHVYHETTCRMVRNVSRRVGIKLHMVGLKVITIFTCEVPYLFFILNREGLFLFSS